MSAWQMTRRGFLKLAGAVGLVAAVGCPPAGCGRYAWKRSSRGQHQSQAAKKHNANHLYATHDAAAADPAHPGDKSKVVFVSISCERYDRLFQYTDTVDLRHVS